jgi:hypothetical protein
MEYAHCWGSPCHWFWFIPLLFMVLMGVCFVRMMLSGGRRWRRQGRRTGRMPFGWCGCGQGDWRRDPEDRNESRLQREDER